MSALPHSEKKAMFSISAILSARMLGMFMILPILSLYVNTIPGATPSLIGLALGIYGFTQAALQLPFGKLSDHFGRKPVITIGLILFALGSLVGAVTHSMTGLIIARALQGGGAVGSTLLALMADLTRDENRSKAMAFLGMSIGISFSIALILGPLVNGWFHLSGIFWVTFLFALICIALLYLTVPTPPKLVIDPSVETTPQYIKQVLKNPELLRLDFGIFTMHAVLTATFIGLPHLLSQNFTLSMHAQTGLYLVILLVGFITMVPFIIIGEKKRRMRPIFLMAIIVLLLGEAGLLLLNNTSLFWVALCLLLFFFAFSLLEASLPSLVSKLAPIRQKGTAMGIYSTAQFFGIFFGGSLGGVLFEHYSFGGLFLFCIMLIIFWLLIALSMKKPPHLSTLYIHIGAEKAHNGDALQRLLKQMNGVTDVAFLKAEDLLVVKIDKAMITEPELRQRVNESNL